MADEALSSFLALLESVPKWIADLESLLETLNPRPSANLPETKPAEIPAQARKPSRCSSRRSRRSEHVKPKTEQDVTPNLPQTTLVPPQLLHLTTSDALRLSQRKRKTASARTGDRSGPSKYRMRSMAVIYYDGDVQKRFEMLVRAVGSCRNAIRKGKMGAKVDNISRLARAGSSSSEDSGRGNIGKDMTVNLGKLGRRSIRPERNGYGIFSKRDDTGIFNTVDGLLEKGQGLCERAAHQVLRDGDCTLELTNANKHFTEVQTLAEKEVPLLRRRAEKAAESQREGAEEAVAQERHLDVLNTQDIVASFDLSNGALEVDESDEEEVPDFGLVSKLQSGRYQMRSSRILASA